HPVVDRDSHCPFSPLSPTEFPIVLLDNHLSYHGRMAPAPTRAAGSVGVVETRYLDLPKPVRLDCGQDLHPVRIAYETYGTLNPARDNVILVCHALSGDAHAAGFAQSPPAESTRDGFGAEDRDGTAGKGLGWWDGMIGPG